MVKIKSYKIGNEWVPVVGDRKDALSLVWCPNYRMLRWSEAAPQNVTFTYNPPKKSPPYIDENNNAHSVFVNEYDCWDDELRAWLKTPSGVSYILFACWRIEPHKWRSGLRPPPKAPESERGPKKSRKVWKQCRSPLAKFRQCGIATLTPTQTRIRRARARGGDEAHGRDGGSDGRSDEPSDDETCRGEAGSDQAGSGEAGGDEEEEDGDEADREGGDADDEAEEELDEEEEEDGDEADREGGDADDEAEEELDEEDEEEDEKERGLTIMEVECSGDEGYPVVIDSSDEQQQVLVEIGSSLCSSSSSDGEIVYESGSDPDWWVDDPIECYVPPVNETNTHGTPPPPPARANRKPHKRKQRSRQRDKKKAGKMAPQEVQGEKEDDVVFVSETIVVSGEDDEEEVEEEVEEDEVMEVVMTATVLEELGRTNAPKRQRKPAAQGKKVAQVETVEEQPAAVEVVEQQRPAQVGRTDVEKRLAKNAKKARNRANRNAQKAADTAAGKGKKRGCEATEEVQKKTGGPEEGGSKKQRVCKDLRFL
ncbi:hypothetical protein EX30DRAFT_374947 [Ascodesmis nigricans]|uniref:Uncharacterized protein n=1 Tax=Ascodesmis nigricans TaxID=341454 RepID=A0A4S2MJR1_9PEZI|nr:hypothetical protein EX30DRAFT_374947 [Ascodesmis nigricans]